MKNKSTQFKLHQFKRQARIEQVVNFVFLYLDLVKVQIMYFPKQNDDEIMEKFRKQSFG